MSTYDIVEGLTATVDFQLLESGAAIDLTSLTVNLLLEDREGNVISSPGTILIPSPTTGHVQLVPTNASVFVAANGPYLARWQITDTLGRVSYCPTSVRDVWNIVGQ